MNSRRAQLFVASVCLAMAAACAAQRDAETDEPDPPLYEQVCTGHYDRPEGHTTFRWGMYIGGRSLVKHGALVFVTGVTIKQRATGRPATASIAPSCRRGELTSPAEQQPNVSPRPAQRSYAVGGG